MCPVVATPTERDHDLLDAEAGNYFPGSRTEGRDTQTLKARGGDSSNAKDAQLHLTTLRPVDTGEPSPWAGAPPPPHAAHNSQFPCGQSLQMYVLCI